MLQVTIWRRFIACWILKDTNTHSEYEIFIAFPLLQWCAVEYSRGTALNDRKVTVSFPDAIIENFHLLNPSGNIIALGSTYPVTEMSTRDISWREAWQSYHFHLPIVYKFLEPKISGTLRACPGQWLDRFMDCLFNIPDFVCDYLFLKILQPWHEDCREHTEANCKWQQNLQTRFEVLTGKFVKVLVFHDTLTYWLAKKDHF